MRFLLTNDDGIDSPGLLALVETFKARGEVYVIAPHAQRSGFGHAFSYKRPVYYRELTLPDGVPAIAVEGTPVDCVKMGLFWTQQPFDWVISGLNLGANIGVDCFYSGTVGAATEGAIQGVPGLAFSLQTFHNPAVDSPMNEHAAAAICGKLFDRVAAEGMGPHDCLSVNIPAIPADRIKGVWPSAQAHQRYIPKYVSEPAEDGRSVLFRPEVEILPDEADDADHKRLLDGWITVTPLTIDRTDAARLEVLRSWSWNV